MRGLKVDRNVAVIAAGHALSRTCGAASTNSGCKHLPSHGWPTHSTSSPWRSDHQLRHGKTPLGVRLQAMQQRLPNHALPRLAAVFLSFEIDG
jgi:hypothetical protein